MLFSVAGTFIYFLDHFKLYSTFCASHCQAQEVLREYNIIFKYLINRHIKLFKSSTFEIHRGDYNIIACTFKSLAMAQCHFYVLFHAYKDDTLKALSGIHINKSVLFACISNLLHTSDNHLCMRIVMVNT